MIWSLFLLLSDEGFEFPFQVDGSLQWSMRCVTDLFQKPTLVMLLRPVQLALQQIGSLFPNLDIRVPPRSWPELGVYIPLRGLKVSLPSQLLQEARRQICSFTNCRPVRRAGDMSRPLT